MKFQFSKLDFFKKMTLIMVFLTAIVVCMYVVSTVTAMSKKSAKKNQTAQKESVVNVSIKAIAPEHFSEIISLNAELRSLYGSISITAPVPGTYVKNNVKLGDYVKKGDVLGYVDATDVGLSYNSAPVIAKTDGTITEIPCYINQKVSTSNVLYTIEPDADFVLKSSVSESDVDSIKSGSLGYFVTAGDKNTNHTARLTYIAPSVNPTTRTVAIEMTVDKDSDNLKGLRNGSFVELKLVKSVINDAIVLPKDAVRTYGGKDVVYRVDSEWIARRVEVTTGLRNQSQIVITDGLKYGDKVVVQGSPQDGDKVKMIQFIQ